MSKKFKLGVIGNPIEHSLSPFIHSRFARQENINLDYQAYKVDEDGFHGFTNEFFADSLAKGLNVTMPFKKSAAEIEGSISDEAKQINAITWLSAQCFGTALLIYYIISRFCLVPFLRWLEVLAARKIGKGSN